MIKRTYFLSLLLVLFLVAGCASLVPSSLSEREVTGPGYDVDISTELGDLDFHPNQVLLRLSPTADAFAIASSLGSTVLQDWDVIHWGLFSVPPGETVASFMEKAMALEGVFHAQPNLQLESIQPVPHRGLLEDELGLLDEDEFEIGAEWFLDRLWGMKDINAPAVWERGQTGCENVIVAVVDTGVKMDHEAFEGHTFIGEYNATHDGWAGGAGDFHGHGTHVAGTAVNDGRTGKLAGVSWDSPIMPVRVMDTEGLIYTNYLIEAMLYVGDYVEDSDMRAVVNMSIGGRGYNIAFKDAIDYAAERGVLLVTSAGNAYKRVISFPSAYNGVVCVAASTPHQVKADFSTTGWWNDVAAPGVKIWSATADSLMYGPWQGTSMASPHVAGAAALLLAEYPDLTPLQIKNQLEQTARPGAYGAGFTEELGHGIIDVEALLGDLQPLQYGSLHVETNVEYGLVTIFDEIGNMVAFGATGLFEDHKFHALKPGTYIVTLSVVGELVKEENVVIGVGTDKSISLEIDLATCTVIFAVTDGDEEPVEGALVEIQRLYHYEFGYTDAEGQAELTAVDGFEYQYQVTKDDVEASGTFEASPDKVIPVTLEIIELEKYQVTFQVNNTLGEPLEGAYVDIYHYVGDEEVILDYDLTDAEGQAVLNVPAGSFFYWVEKLVCRSLNT